MAEDTHTTFENYEKRAAAALGKIDRFGQRGITLVTAQEIEAMAIMLVHYASHQTSGEEK